MKHAIAAVKEKNPLVLHYTNEVTINDCANITLALGASPLMSYSLEEVEQIVSISNAVVINIGTMNSAHIELFIRAGETANKHEKPIVLDPVGVFATQQRIELTEKLLQRVKFDVIKGNGAEIQFIAGLGANGKGVDANDDIEWNDEKLKELAQSLNCTIAATGKVDIITNGTELTRIHNGTPKLKSITGTGCMTASLIGSYLGATNDAYLSAVMGVATMSICGELADETNPPIGQFKVNLMNEVYTFNEATFAEKGKVTHNETYRHPIS